MLKLFLLTSCLQALAVIVECSIPAGFYIDNGRDQTMLEHVLTMQEKREVELEILHLLGLPSRPRRMSEKQLTKSAPKFLLDVYRSLLEKENGREERSADLDISGEERNAIDESDIIMTFDSISHHVPGVRHERGKRLWFNVTDVPIGDDIVGAELRIFQNQNYTNKKANAKFTVTAYELINTDDGERELEYITSINTTAGFTGWLELNLTKCLTTWVAFPDSNKGIYLSVHPVNRAAHEIRPEDIGLVTVKSEDETQPFMVAFLKNNHQGGTVRVARDTRRVRKSEYPQLMQSYKHDASIQPDWRSCRIQNLYISFKDLKWHDWIIAPPGYEAYYCAGECNFPLNSHMNATNHAIVQTLAHLVNPLKFPKPCCAPTRLTPISVLYYLNDANVTLKKYQRMVVKSCGCL
ncbi:protein 60A [Atheta coriaria]|uniref:protein 60A n=1 Tax=Dalotia coriaria TaxID=877792 RepID=UPI0031F38E7E